MFTVAADFLLPVGHSPLIRLSSTPLPTKILFKEVIGLSREETSAQRDLPMKIEATLTNYRCFAEPSSFTRCNLGDLAEFLERL